MSFDFLGPDEEAGVYMDVGVGMRFSERYSAEVSVGHHAWTASDTGFLISGLRYEYDLGATSVNATLRFYFATKPRFDFYGLAGVGLYRVTLAVKATDEGTVFRDTSTTESAFGLHLGAGLSYAVARHVALGAELTYAFVNGEYSAPGDAEKFSFGGLRAAGVLELRL